MRSVAYRDLSEPYFQRLRNIGSTWCGAIELSITIDGHNGTTRFRLVIPQSLAGGLGSDEPFLKLLLPQAVMSVRRSYRLAGSTPDVFGFRVNSGHSIEVVRTADGAIGLQLRNTSVGDLGDLDVEFASLSFQHAIPELIPFNRSVFSIVIKWGSGLRPAARVMFVRPRELVTCFTTGNYTLAFPSRPSRESTVTHIFFSQADSHFIEYGFSYDERDEVTSILSAILVTMFSAGLLFFLTNYVHITPESNIAQVFIMIIVLTMPVYIVLSRASNLERLHYYMNRSPTTLLINILLSIISLVNVALLMYAILFSSNTNNFYVMRAFSIVIDLRGIYLIQSGILFLAFISLILLQRLGVLVRYVCDNADCKQRLYLRFRRKNCFSTGRIMCDSCYRCLCERCTSNCDVNIAALETGTIFDVQHAENLCQDPTLFASVFRVVRRSHSSTV